MDLLIAALAALFIAGAGGYVRYDMAHKQPRAKPQWFNGISEGLLELFDALPEAHRPYSRVELETTLHALDKKYMGEVSPSYDHLNIRWTDYNMEYKIETPYWSPVRMPEYLALAEALCNIQASLNRQKREFVLARIPTEHLDISTLVDRARQESQIIEDVTREVIG